MSLILQVIPSLIGHIIIMLNFNYANWSFFLEHKFRRWAKLTLIFLVISFRLEQQCLILSLCHTHGSNNLSLHHSFNLMSSPIDYIFMKSLDKCVVIINSIRSSSRISIEFMMRNTILPLEDLCYQWQLYGLPSITNLFMTWMQLAIQLVLWSTLKYYCLLCQ